jgi:uncharacterized protein (TIGR02996 family)
MDVARTLLAAGVALDAGDRARALAKLLAAWRQLRHPRIAELVDYVSGELTAKAEPIKGKTIAARTAAWHAVEKRRDAAELGRLLATPWPGTWQPAVPVLKPLLEWPDDPRMAMAFARIVDDTPYDTWTSKTFYAPLFARLDELRDLRTLPLLEQQLAKDKSYYYARDMRPLEERAVKALRRAFPRGKPPAITRPIEAALATVEAFYRDRIAGTQDKVRGEAEHLAAIHADPADLAARAVFADWLQERGDPRGEFIALQLARVAGQPGDPARERKLLADHGRAWAGALDKYFGAEHRVFDGGFFAGGVLSELDLTELEATLRDPAWRLVRVLSARDEQLVALLDRPELVSVRAVRDVVEETAAAIAGGRPRALTELGFIGRRNDADAPHDRKPLEACVALPDLRTLGVHPYVDTLDWLLEAPVLERIECLTIGSVARGLANALEAIARRAGSLRELRLLSRFSPMMAPDGWSVTLRRDSAPGPFTALTARFHTGKHGVAHRVGLIEEVLDAIPASWLRSIDIDAGRKLTLKADERAGLAKLVARFDGLDDVKVPWEAPPKRPAKSSGRDYAMELEGPGMLDPKRIGPIWKLVVEELGQQYDSFEVGTGNALRKLDDKPFEQIKKWAANKRAGSLELLRDGAAGSLTLNRHGRYATERTSAELVGIERSPEELADWFVRFCDLAKFWNGTVKLATSRYTQEDFLFPGYSAPDGGWLMFFGRPLADVLPLKRVQQLAARRELAGMFARATKHGLLVGIAASPDEATSKRLRALADPLRSILVEGVIEHLGYDLTALARATLGPIAKQLGLAFEATQDPATEVRFVNRKRQLVVDVRWPLDGPSIDLELRHGARNGYRVHELASRKPANTRAQVEKQLAVAAKAALADAAKWFAKAEA